MNHNNLQTIQDRIQYLRENTDFISAVFDSLIGYAIIAADFDGNIIAYNEGAHQIYGYAPEEVIGKENIDIFFPGKFIKAGGMEQVASELLNKRQFSTECEQFRKDGTKFPAHILFTLPKDKKRQIVGFVEIVEDLTERKRAEDTLRQLQLKQLQLKQLEKESAEAARNYQHYLAISQGGPFESEALPHPDEEKLKELFPDYRETVLRYVRAVRIREERPSDRVRELARRLSVIGFQARDVVKLHLRVLNEFSQRAMPGEDRAFSNDARLVLVELMGNLIDVYRNVSRKKGSGKGAQK